VKSAKVTINYQTRDPDCDLEYELNRGCVPTAFLVQHVCVSGRRLTLTIGR
jgi:hypothetical protein